ncbi:MAG TPA: sigma-70 family RNA polymerase sigma factor [Candidatus Limnocylindrales bacterium]|jgi:RNA polymerase sigma-70 factor (ECF subfamily)|nr:sigma-70 family RNA polymerase sigma factor [Candidatus Limnocylindrales bacterium]
MSATSVTIGDETPAGLIGAAAGGSEAAFAIIVERHYVAMTRVCFVVCRDADVAAEAVQASWPIAWQKLGSLRDPERLGAWLASIAVNEARQLVRRRRRRSIVEIQVAASGSHSMANPADRVEDLDLARALDRLEADDRALLALRYVAGLNATELGRGLGMSASGTRRRLARLLMRLRTELGDE